MDLIKRLDELLPSPACAYEALENILHSCETPENVAERTQLSVQLSLCEFAAANVEYPEVCRISSQTAVCTRILESKPTWWTTYSGNFRHISTICQEFRPQYQTTQFLNVLENTTNMMASFNAQQRVNLNFAEMNMEWLVSQWNYAKENFTNELSKSGRDLVDTQSLLKMSILETLAAVGNISTNFDNIVSELSAAEALAAKSKHESDSLYAKLSEVKEELDQVQLQYYHAATMLNVSVERTVTVLEATNAALEGSAKTITTFCYLLEYMAAMVAKFGLLLCLIATLVLLGMRYAASKKHGRETLPSKQNLEVDLIFM